MEEVIISIVFSFIFVPHNFLLDEPISMILFFKSWCFPVWSYFYLTLFFLIICDNIICGYSDRFVYHWIDPA